LTVYRSILVPLDGSAFGECALPVALGIARRAGARLHLAHVHLLPAPLFAERRPNVENTRDPQALEKARAYLDGVVHRLAARTDVRLNSVLLEGGVVEALQEHVAGNGVDLVVMTTHGRGPLSRFWLGSVADEFLRRAEVPLLLVRPQQEAPDLAREPLPRHILVPLDGSALAEQVLPAATALGSLVEADCTLMRVVQPVVPTAYDPVGFATGQAIQPMLDQLRVEAQEYLDRVAQRLRAQALTIHTQVVIDQQLAGAIFDEAAARGSDLIALATHGRHGLARLLLGSVADKVIRGASLPVLVYRPDGARPAGS
jgi:nucleotide-binding universal stress UspA family protein